MTHTIHPKMLEKVASAISRELYGRVTYIAGEAATTERLKGIAQAAILAFCEGLPIEDAPKDKEIVVLHNGQFLANVVMRHNVWMLRHSYPVIYTLLSPQPTRFHPTPNTGD